MKEYKIGIVGYGYVGKGIHRLFGKMIKVIYSPSVRTYKGDFIDLDLVVICVPTNAKENGEADTSIVWSSLKWLDKVVKKETVILIKSTVPPSELRKMTEKFPRIVFSPEYMGESKYFTPFWKYPHPKEMKSHTWQVFGGNKKDTSKCVDIFKRKMSVDTIFIQTSLITASLAKYMENCFFATKVTFCNEWFDIAKAYGVDYNELRDAWLCDTRINRNHTLVFPRDRGYGGKCYPKDMMAIIKDAEKSGYKTELMKAINKINKEFRCLTSK